MKQKSVVVVGAGIIGLSCAIRLSQGGARVHVVAPGSGDGDPSWGNAGHIAVEQTAPLASRQALLDAGRNLYCFGGAVDFPLRDTGTWLPFAARFARASSRGAFERGERALAELLADAIPAWRRLEADCNGPQLIDVNGHLVTWETAPSAERGRAKWGSNLRDTARHRVAGQDELDELRSHVNVPIDGAIRFLETAQLFDPVTLQGMLADAVRGAGGEFVDATVESLLPANGRGAVHLDSGSRLEGDAVVVAAGVRTRPLLHALGLHAPLIAERGYHVEARDPDWPLHLPPIVFEDRSVILTRFRHALRLCGFVEFSRVDSPPDVTKWERLERTWRELGLPVRQPLKRWMGSRPTLPDYLPAIGRSPNAPQFFYATGHQHLGLTLGPLTGELIAGAVLGEGSQASRLAPFDLARFGRR